MSLLFLDFETRSTLNLKDHGLNVYAAHPSTEVLCTGWAFDDEPVNVAAGAPLPLEAFFNSTIVAHNAAFEREIITRMTGERLPWNHFIDTAALAARMSLPRALGPLAEALHLSDQKDAAGHTIMLKLARPKKGWSGDEFWEEEEKPEDFATLRSYCAQDVAVSREAFRRLIPLSMTERRLYALTGTMNDRGVKVDLSTIPSALALLETCSRPEHEEFKAITGGASVKSYKRAAATLGLPNMKKVTVRHALRGSDLTPSVRRALELFQRLAKSSPAKLTALQRRTSIDGRVRGALIYCGAERTGRWSSGGVQLHNIPKGLGKKQDQVFTALGLGAVDLCYDNPVETIALALRGFFVGPFVVGDYAQIEARVLNWLAGQKDIVNLFASGADVYSHTASRIFGYPVTKETEDKSLPVGVTPRFVGKTAELGCGYGLGAEKFRKQLDEQFDVQITEHLAARAVEAYRASHAKVLEFWKLLDEKFKYAVARNLPRVEVDSRFFMGNIEHGGLRYAYIELPSGRRLYYAEPKIVMKKPTWSPEPRPVVEYWGRNIYAGGKWDRITTYGGKLAENVTQALSRDILAHAMLRLDDAGFTVVLQVHDEIVAEVNEQADLQDNFKSIMLETPSWASGLPVDVEVFQSHRYRK